VDKAKAGGLWTEPPLLPQRIPKHDRLSMPRHLPAGYRSATE